MNVSVADNRLSAGGNEARIYDIPRLNDAISNSGRLLNDDVEPQYKKDCDKFSEKTRDSLYVSTFGKALARPNTLKVPCRKTYSRSAENVKCEMDSLPAQNVYLDVNGYKTFFAVCDDGDYCTVAEHSRQFDTNYTWEYDTETLQALNKVTRKFDSFRMRQLKAKFFNASDNSNEMSENVNNVLSGNLKDEGSILFHTKTSKSNDFNKVSYAASKLLIQQKNLNTQDITENELNYEQNQRNALKISKEENERIEFFYSCLGCEIYVAGCVVDVLASIRTNNAPAGWESESSPYRWVQVWVGVPVLVLDIGQMSSRPRRLTIVVAQRDTGMPLWMERVTYATDYKQLENEGLHLLTGAGNEKRSLKIRWSDWECAKDFLERYKLLTANQNDSLWLNESKPKLNKKRISNSELSPFTARDLKKYNPSCDNTPKLKNNRFEKQDYLPDGNVSNKRNKGLTKENISVPCNLRHMTKVDIKDVSFRTTFAGLLPVTGKKHLYKTLQDDEFRPRLPTN